MNTIRNFLEEVASIKSNWQMNSREKFGGLGINSDQESALETIPAVGN